MPPKRVFPGVRRCEMSKEEQEQGLKTPTGLARRSENSRIFQVEMTDLQTDVGKLRSKRGRIGESV